MEGWFAFAQPQLGAVYFGVFWHVWGWFVFGCVL
jgi:hypothetical protein